MKLLYTLLISALLSSAAFAQSNYHQGYVLKNNGDTLKGFINYHEWTRSPKIIDFKIAKNDKKDIEFSPATIKGFQIDGMETFISYIGIISTNKTIFPDYPQEIDTSKMLDTIFLQQVVAGKHLTLYYNSDNIKTRFFIAEANTVPVELNYYVYYNKYNQVVTLPVYTGQLQLYILKFYNGNDKLINSLEKISYDQPNLETIINNINDGHASNANNSKKRLSRFFAGVGLNSTNTEFASSSGVANVDKIANSISPKISFGVDLFNNPNVQQLIFRAEVSLWYATPRFNTPVTINDAQTTEVYEFNQYSASITPQILLNIYNKDNFKFYIDGGWAFNFSTYNNNKITVKNEDAATTAAYTQQEPYILQGFWSNFPIQAGIVLNKRWEIYASYNFYAAYTEYFALSVANQSTSLGIKFLLK